LQRDLFRESNFLEQPPSEINTTDSAYEEFAPGSKGIEVPRKRGSAWERQAPA
jgi:hypothetical protein